MKLILKNGEAGKIMKKVSYGFIILILISYALFYLLGKDKKVFLSATLKANKNIYKIDDKIILKLEIKSSKQLNIKFYKDMSQVVYLKGIQNKPIILPKRKGKIYSVKISPETSFKFQITGRITKKNKKFFIDFGKYGKINIKKNYLVLTGLVFLVDNSFFSSNEPLITNQIIINIDSKENK